MSDQDPKQNDTDPLSLDDDMIDIDSLDDDIPMVDDLADLGSDDVDLDDTLDEYEDFGDLDDFDDAFDDDSSVASSYAPNKGKLKSGLSLEKKLIFGGVIVVALYVLFSLVWPMIGGGGANTPSDVEMSADMMPSDPVVEPQAAVNEPPMPTPIINEGFEAEMVQPVLQDSADQSQQTVSPLTPLPSFDDQEPGDILPASSNTGSLLPPIDEPADITVSDQTESLLPAEQPEVQIPVAKEEMVTTEPEMLAPAPSSGISPEIATRLENNEAQIQLLVNKLDAVLDQMKANSADLNSRLQLMERSLDQAKATEPVFKPKVSAKAKASKPAQVQKKKAPVRKVAPKAVAIRWVLKSAQPGRAVVANAATGDMRSVEVGSSLSGLGRITSISNATGLWVVQGTSGRVSQ